MATLTLTKIFINLLSTGASVSAYSQPDRPATYEKRGDVRIYAGGRLRSVTQEGTPGTFSFVLIDVTRTQITLLRNWAGLPVQVRDNRSRIFQGVFYKVDEHERRNEPTLYDVPIELNVITFVEEI
jgi:hypothetical protein